MKARHVINLKPQENADVKLQPFGGSQSPWSTHITHIQISSGKPAHASCEVAALRGSPLLSLTCHVRHLQAAQVPRLALWVAREHLAI